MLLFMRRCVEPDRPHTTTRRMRIACCMKHNHNLCHWLPKATMVTRTCHNFTLRIHCLCGQQVLRNGRYRSWAYVKRRFLGCAVVKSCTNQWRTQEFCSEGGVQQIQLRTEDRENGYLGKGSPQVRGSGGSCFFGTRNFISYSKILLIFGTLRLFMMTTNLFVIANVKQLRT